MGGLSRAGHGRQPWAQLLIGRERRDAVVVEHQPEHLPGVALQRCQAAVDEQPPRHALVPIATEWEGVAGRRRRGHCTMGAGARDLGGREVLQRSVEQVGECDGALTRGSWAVSSTAMAQSNPRSTRFLIAAQTTESGSDMPSAGSMAASRIEVSSSRSTFLLLVTAFHCRQSSVSRVSSRRGGALALGQAEDLPPQGDFLMGQAIEAADHLVLAPAAACDRPWRFPSPRPVPGFEQALQHFAVDRDRAPRDAGVGQHADQRRVLERIQPGLAKPMALQRRSWPLRRSYSAWAITAWLSGCDAGHAASLAHVRAPWCRLQVQQTPGQAEQPK